MPITITDKLDLTKPDDDEPGNVAVLNDNWDRIDGAVGVKWVNDGAAVTLPASSLYHGLVIREVTNRRAWVARETAPGVFALVPLTTLYGVWNYTGDLEAISPGTPWILGAPVFSVGTLTTPDVTISGKALLVSTPGVYHYLLKANLAFAGSAGTYRRFIESVISPTTTWEVRQPGGNDDESLSVRGVLVVNSGTVQSIQTRIYQASGGPLNIASASIQLVRSP